MISLALSSYIRAVGLGFSGLDPIVTRSSPSDPVIQNIGFEDISLMMRQKSIL
jgi:hypothetical protein